MVGSDERMIVDMTPAFDGHYGSACSYDAKVPVASAVRLRTLDVIEFVIGTCPAIVAVTVGVIYILILLATI